MKETETEDWQNKISTFSGVCIDRYTLEQSLGKGGMGSVYKGKDPELGRSVAIKLLHPHLLDDKDAQKRFRREAQALAGLNHPNVVQIYDFGITKSSDIDYPYLVTEFVDGPNLAELSASKGAIGFEVVSLLLSQMVDALAYAHSKGTRHRDIKPENYLITKDGWVKLADFGIARGKEMTTLTEDGSIAASIAYMAPEVLENDSPSFEADVFALGVVVYELLSGNHPFEKDRNSTAQLMMKIIECQAPKIENLTSPLWTDLVELIEDSMSKDPRDRPCNAQEFQERFKGMFSDLDIKDPHEHLSSFLRKPKGVSKKLRSRVLSKLKKRISLLKAEGSPQNRAKVIDLADKAQALAPNDSSLSSSLIHGKVSKPPSEEAGTASRHFSPFRISAVVAVIISLLILSLGSLARSEKRVFLDALPPPVEESRVAAGIDKLRKDFGDPISLVRLRSLVHFVSSYIHLPDDKNRISRDDSLRQIAKDFEKSHFWTSRQFTLNVEEQSYSILEALDVDPSKELALYELIEETELAIAYLAIRCMHRKVFLQVLLEQLRKKLEKDPPKELWRREEITELLSAYEGPGTSPLERFKASQRIFALARIGKVGADFLLKDFPAKLEALDDEEHEEWETIANAFSKIQYAASMLIYDAKPRSMARRKLFLFLLRFLRQRYNRIHEVDSAKTMAASIIVDLDELAKSYGLSLKSHLEVEPGKTLDFSSFAKLKDKLSLLSPLKMEDLLDIPTPEASERSFRLQNKGRGWRREEPMKRGSWR